MTGLNTIYRFSSIASIDVEKIKRMTMLMHSDMDERISVWHDDYSVLSHTGRLFWNNDKTLIVACDGEIYNTEELLIDLEIKRCPCRSNKSGELILHLYKLYGNKCVDYLRGSFAFCIYDVVNKKMVVARDRIGEKTLYYAQLPTGIVISTELKTILKEYIVNPQINITSLLEPIRYIAPLSMEQTWIQQIKRVQPGHYLEIDENGMCDYQYWKRCRNPQIDCSREEALRNTLSLMQESVNISMRSDKPIAIMLSGGIDSSAVAALAKRAGYDVHTITVGFGGEVEYDERSVARRFAQEQGFDYNEIVLNPEDYIKAFEELTQYIDEPITDSAVLAQWVMYKKVKSLGYDIVLSGMGGDELFYNYAWLNNQANARKLHHEFEKICPVNTLERKQQWFKMMRKNWKALIMPQAWHMTNEASYIPWHYESYEKFIRDATLKYRGQEYHLIDYTPHQVYLECPVGFEIEQAYDDAFDRIMVGAYLYLGGKVANANEISVRCPLIDYKLVDYVMHIPYDIKGCNKSFMKEMLKDILPSYILYGQKRGFTPTSQYTQMISDKHKYSHIHSSSPFYPVALTDQIISRLLQ